MSREKQLVKNTAIVAVGKICTQFISFFLLPLYTAMLTTAEYGTVDLLNTYVSLLIPIITFQIEQAIFRFLIDVRNDEQEQKKLISTTFFIAIIQSVLFLIIYFFIAEFINNSYKYFLATNVVACIFSSIMLQICRGLGDNKLYSIGSLISAICTVTFNILFLVVFKLGAYGMLSATLLANVLCALFIIFKKKLYKYLKVKLFTKELLKKLWKYSIPLIPNALSWWIVNASDRTIITTLMNVGANGVYSAANKFSAICIQFFNIFNLTWTESASMYINDKDSSKYFSNIMNTTLKLFCAICIGIIAFMPFVFSLLINERYNEAYYQIPILMLSTLFNIVVCLLGSVYVAKKKTNEIAKTSVMAAIINIVVNVALIKHIGLYAASISTLVAYLSMAIYRYIDVQRLVKIRIDKKLLLMSFPMVVIVGVAYYSKNLYGCLTAAVLAIVYAWFMNRETLLGMLDTLKKKIGKREFN